MQWKNGTRQIKLFMTSHNLITHQMIKNKKNGPNVSKKRGGKVTPKGAKLYQKGGNMSYLGGRYVIFEECKCVRVS